MDLWPVDGAQASDLMHGFESRGIRQTGGVVAARGNLERQEREGGEGVVFVDWFRLARQIRAIAPKRTNKNIRITTRFNVRGGIFITAMAADCAKAMRQHVCATGE